ncbi:MAG: LuxR C-terminal-related transcriptional regulator [Chloroflexota bacterium]
MEQLLATKLYIPSLRAGPDGAPRLVLRPRLVERLNEGLRREHGFGRKLTLISAPAGFGKTTLVSEWIAACEQRTPQVRAAWLSLDKGDSEPARFLAYLVAALQTLVETLGVSILSALQSPQPPASQALLTALLNEIAALPDPFILVLDDYHAIDSKPVDQALAFLLDHLPPQMHLVIASREDPSLPLARLRAQGLLTELRAADLRFTSAEAAEFLNQASGLQGMGLALSAEELNALETRTEGWIAGLQLAALAMQGQSDTASFIQAFTGSHRFVLDYLLEEVLQQQPESIQAFLLRTSILERLCGPLCDAVLLDSETPGQETLEFLERANLFIVPLDNQRRWYRYHHLFAEFLRQRAPREQAGLHMRASQWFEEAGLKLEAFQHAAAAHDIQRAERLIGAKGMTIHSRGTLAIILDWLASLPAAVKDARPSLWVRSATLALVGGQTGGVEENLNAAEKALQNAELDARNRDLIGQIAAARATLALTRYQPEVILAQAQRALEYLPPEDLAFRLTAFWTLGFAHYLLGDRAAAAQAYTQALEVSQEAGDSFSTILATGSLGQVQELENQLHLAAASYRRVLELAGEHPLPNIGETHLDLARIYYEWNDLEAAEQHARQSLPLVRLYDRLIDRFVLTEIFLARLELARGDIDGAAGRLAQTEQSVRQNNFVQRLPEVAAAQVLVLIRQGKLQAAAQLVQAYPLPLHQARLLLAQGDLHAALALLEPLRQEMQTKGWQDERLKALVLEALALRAQGEKQRALQALAQALALAEPGGFIRLFVDEGPPMARLLSEAAAQGVMPGYTARLLAAFEKPPALRPASLQPLVEPLSLREMEVLRLVAQGLSNREISAKLFLAVDTVKGYNRRIFDKLHVQRRTEAIARARELGLL